MTLLRRTLLIWAMSGWFVPQVFACAGVEQAMRSILFKDPIRSYDMLVHTGSFLVAHVDAYPGRRVSTKIVSVRDQSKVPPELLRRLYQTSRLEAGTMADFVVDSMGFTLGEFRERQNWSPEFIGKLKHYAWKYKVFSTYIFGRLTESARQTVSSIRLIRAPYIGSYVRGTNGTGEFKSSFSMPMVMEDYLGIRVRENPINVGFVDPKQPDVVMLAGENIELGALAKRVPGNTPDPALEAEISKEIFINLVRVLTEPQVDPIFSVLGYDTATWDTSAFKRSGTRYFAFATEKTMKIYRKFGFRPIPVEDMVTENGQPVKVPIERDGVLWTPMETGHDRLLEFLDIAAHRRDLDLDIAALAKESQTIERMLFDKSQN